MQEAFVRLQGASPAEPVRSAKSYLTAVVTRLAIDQLRSARARRETYVGPWLPEPLVGAVEPDAEDRALAADSLSMAFLVLLESLTPVERAVFLLHDVFELEFAEIADIVAKSEVNCRQIAARARREVDARRPRFEPSRATRDELARRFFAAASGGDLDGLVQLLAADAAFYGDGGGKGRGLPHPVLRRRRPHPRAAPAHRLLRHRAPALVPARAGRRQRSARRAWCATRTAGSSMSTPWTSRTAT